MEDQTQLKVSVQITVSTGGILGDELARTSLEQGGAFDLANDKVGLAIERLIGQLADDAVDRTRPQVDAAAAMRRAKAAAKQEA